jgi:predicted metalloendopeptidase
VAALLGLAGDPDPARAAQTVMAIESALARGSMRRVDRREPAKIYHRLERRGLEALAPHLNWSSYFRALGYPDVTAINVAVPDFFAALDNVLTSNTVDDLRAYLRWQLVHRAAPALGKAFVDEDFRFRAKNLSGEEQILPRWKRCVSATDRALGEALAQPFVALRFGEAGKARAKGMIEQIEAAMRADLHRLAWMDDPTRAEAKDKLGRVFNKVGYPDKWRNYDRLVVDRSSYLANRMRADAFESVRQLDKIGKPVDKAEWEMTPPTVNAYYEASLNEMVFPAGILAPPFFDVKAGDPTNYGAIGMAMGHELTHGFDDKGRKFDGLGNLRDWWTPTVGQAFEQRAECLARQYASYEPLTGERLDGHLTLGENIADLGGLKLALGAERAAHADAPPVGSAAGFDERQQIFLGFAQAWCAKRRDSYQRMLLTVDTHSPPRFRVNGVAANLPEFAEAFACAPGSKMAPAQRCQFW